MRLLFLTHRLPYAPNRGDRIRAHYLLKVLAEHFDVDLLSLVHDDEEAAHGDDLRDLAASVTTVRPSGVDKAWRITRALVQDSPLTHALLGSRAMTAALRRARQRQPDVVLAYCSGMAQYLFHPAVRDLPAVLDMVDVDSAKWRDLAAASPAPRSWLYRREARVLRRFEVAAMARADATFAVSDRERDECRHIAPGARVMTVANGIDTAFFHPVPAPSAEPTVVFCGVMHYAPNAQGAIWFAREVWPSVVTRIPGARLLIVGASPSADVVALARLTNVTVTGAVPDVRPYLWSAAVAIAPLHIARGLQNKVLEALAAGLPVVITPAVGAGLPPSAAAGCVVAEGAAAFADALLRMLAMPSHERGAMAARADVDTLSWPAQLQPAIHLLHKCARGET